MMRPQPRKKTACLIYAAVCAIAIVMFGCAGQGAGSSEPWSMDSDCASCHTAQLNSMDAPTASGQVSMHAAYDCTMCHTDEASLSMAHENATADAVSQASADEAQESIDCRSCHDRQELVEKTVEGLVKADGKSTANPHSNHVSVDMACTDCHNVHEESVLTCNGCHDFALPEGWRAPRAA